jgi:hypothetical protein
LLLPRPALADQPIIVGDGTAASCTEAALANALAIAETVGGGRIKFHCGGGPVTIPVTATLVIPDNATISGGGTITLLGTNVSAPFVFVAGNTTVALKGLIIRGLPCVTVCNGGVHNHGTLTIHSTTLSDIHVGMNGALTNFGTAMVNHSTFVRNLTTETASAIHNSGTITVKNSFFHNTGGDILNSGTATAHNSTFLGGVQLEELGGGIRNDGTLTVKNCLFSGPNFGTLTGGAIDSTGTITVENSTFSNNTARFGAGGGGLANGGFASVRNSVFVGSVAQSFGGAIANYATLELINSTVADNTALQSFGHFGLGGGIYNAGTLTVVNSRVEGNAAADQGGGIFNLGTLILNNSVITDNTAGVGGGIYNCPEGQVDDGAGPCHGTLILQSTIVTENTPDNIFPR